MHANVASATSSECIATMTSRVAASARGIRKKASGVVVGARHGALPGGPTAREFDTDRELSSKSKDACRYAVRRIGASRARRVRKSSDSRVSTAPDRHGLCTVYAGLTYFRVWCDESFQLQQPTVLYRYCLCRSDRNSILFASFTVPHSPFASSPRSSVLLTHSTARPTRLHSIVPRGRALRPLRRHRRR